MKTVILSWLQNDGTRGFSVDQLKGNNRQKQQGKVGFFKLVYREPPSTIILTNAESIYCICPNLRGT